MLGSEPLEASLARFRARPFAVTTVDGRAWRYVAFGDGAPLVMLVGGLQVADAAFLLAEDFGRDFRVVVPEYPSLRSVSEFALGLAGVLAAEGIDRAHVWGTSLGGAMAQSFVRRFPWRVDRLVLASTFAPDPSYARRLARRAVGLGLLPEALLRRGGERSLLRHVRGSPPAERAFWTAYLREYMRKRWTRETMATQDALLADYCRNERFGPRDLDAWPGRVLLLAGTGDPFFDAERRARLAALYPTARVQTFEGAGHVPWITRSHEYEAVVRAFLRGDERAERHDASVTSLPSRRALVQ